MRGICKGFKYISHIFVVKEEEIEIGFPTDVKHVAHIGWDGPSGSAPSWMTEFKAAPEFSSSLGTMNEHTASAHSSAASSRELSVGLQNSELAKDGTPSDVPKMPKKPKRKKVKPNSSPKASSSPKGSSPVTKSSRATKTKLKHQHADDEKIPS